MTLWLVLFVSLLIFSNEKLTAMPSGHPMDKYSKKMVLNIYNWLVQEGPNVFTVSGLTADGIFLRIAKMTKNPMALRMNRGFHYLRWVNAIILCTAIWTRCSSLWCIWQINRQLIPLEIPFRIVLEFNLLSAELRYRK